MSSPPRAQSWARVVDSAGAAIQNDTVIVMNTLTGENHAMKSTDSGEYVVSNLPVGAYHVETQVTGFKRTLRTGLSLTANQGNLVAERDQPTYVDLGSR